MTLSPRIAPFAATTLEALDGGAYDAALASLGFERRARAIPNALGGVRHRVTVPFPDRREASYADNADFFAGAGWASPPASESAYDEWIYHWIQETAADADVVRIAIDISSMRRTRIATVIEALIELNGVEAEVDLLYAPARYSPPTTNEDPVLSVAPVTGYFAGWWSNLDAPLFAVIGLGYELERAGSAIDHLEPELGEVYVPVGTDPDFMPSVRHANFALLASASLIERVVEYEVGDPFGCFRQLEASIHRLVRDYRVALVPLGPKIYAACALLAAALHPEATQVIRVSAEERERAVDQQADGSVFGLKLLLGHPTATELSATQPIQQARTAPIE